jgi:hypothetical protein
MRRYAIHDWRTDATNLLIISPTGGGKTFRACAIAIGACQSEHAVIYFRMDDLARRLVIARGDSIAHQKLLNELSNIDLLIIDDFLTVGIDSDGANDLLAILANRDHRLPMMIASQTGPAPWVAELPDRVTADSIVDRLANHARIINLGQIDMRRQRPSPRQRDLLGVTPQRPGHQLGPLPPARNRATNYVDQLRGLALPSGATRQPHATPHRQFSKHVLKVEFAWLRERGKRFSGPGSSISNRC